MSQGIQMTPLLQSIIDATPEIKWEKETWGFMYASFLQGEENINNRPGLYVLSTGVIYHANDIANVPDQKISIDQAKKLYKQYVTLAAFG